MDGQDRQNIAVALVVIVLLGAASWLLTTMHRGTKLEECLLARGRNCEQYR